MNATMTAPSVNETGQRFTFHCKEWKDYLFLLDWLGESHLRVTFKKPNLEIMTLSFEHESWNKLLGRLIESLTLELELPIQSGGATTFSREDLERGLEPDQCYYLANEPRVRGKDQIDLSVDPPPDLAVEIEISRSALNRMSIYASMGVPEVWRFDGATLTVHCLNREGEYVQTDRSGQFPFLPLAEFQGFLLRRGQMSETALMLAFQQWVREQIARAWEPSIDETHEGGRELL